MEDRALIVTLNHGGTCAVQRVGLVRLAEQKRPSAVSMHSFIQLFLLLSVLLAGLGLSPRQALAHADPFLHGVAESLVEGDDPGVRRTDL